MFIDEAVIFVKAGKGGDGCISFYRTRKNPKGGPDGGDGGDGGSIYIEADRNLKDLSYFLKNKIFVAQNGKNGSSNNKYGKKGEDLVIHVPVGTKVYKANNFIYDFKNHGERILIAKGGRGGRG
ncbi:MAG: hypothetical protein NZ870_04955, partial [bacterium]|nr:hypothetical protein [bacterium]